MAVGLPQIGGTGGAVPAPLRSGLVPSRLAGAHASRRPARSKVGAYIALTKPRIIELLLVTTLPTMVLADRGIPSVGLMVATMVGGTLAAGGANAINMYVDRDIDRLMPRTQGRPLVTGMVTPTSALVFAVAVELAAVIVLATLVNPLSAVLALGGTLFYVFVYTLWLKRTSTQNIVIGGAAGAVPVLVGWAAVTNSLAWPPVLLFAAIFLWTPPHFWALAIRYADDYRAASVPMLPAVASMEVTSRRMLGYTIALVAVTLLLAPIGHLGLLYLIVAAVTGAVFIGGCIALRRDPTPRRSMQLFAYSITYVTLVFGGMAADVLLRHVW
jgi:heme o synthase